MVNIPDQRRELFVITFFFNDPHMAIRFYQDIINF